MAETIKGINVVIGAETTGLSAALSDVNKKSKDIQSELKQVESLLKLDPSNTELLAQKQKLLSDAVANTKEKLDRLKTAQEQVNEQFAKGDISEGQYRAFQRELAKTAQELQGFESKLKSLEPEIKSFADKVGEAGNKLKETGGKISDTGKSISAGLSLPLLGIGVAAGKAAADVDAAAGMIQARLGVSEEAADRLSQAALRIWENGFGESLDQVNGALAQTGQNIQNLDAASLEQLTQSALTLQEVFDADVNETTRTASVLMKNFQIDGQTAFDLITTGFQKGGDYSGELLDTLREYAPQFAALGISAGDMLGILIKGAENGAFNLDKVGDSVKELGIRVVDQSKTTAEGFKLIGLNADQMSQAFAAGGDKAEGAFKATVAALAAMKDPLAQNTAGVNLFGTQWEDVKKNVILAMADGIGSITEFQGATEKAGQALQDNFGKDVSKAWREMQADLVPLGKILLSMATEYLPPIIALITQLATWFNNLSPAAQGLVLVIAGIAAAIGPVIVVVGELITAVGAIISAFSVVSGVIVSASAAIAAAGGVIAIITGPIGIAIAAVAALAAIVYLVIDNWESIKTFFIGLWEWMKSFFSEWGPLILTFIAPFLGIPLLIYQHWDEISAYLRKLWESITTYLSEVWTQLSTSAIAAFQKMLELIKPILEGYKTFFSGIWEAVKTIFLGAILLLVDLVTGNFTALSEDAQAIWNKLKDAFGTIWDGIKQVFTGYLSILQKGLSTAWDSISTAASKAWDGIKTAISDIVDATVTWVKDTWTSLITWFKEMPGTLYTVGSDMFNRMHDAVEATVTTVKEAIVTGITAALDWLRNLPATMTELGKNMIQGLIDGIKNMVGKVGEAIKSIADKVTGGIRNALDIHSPSRVMEGLGEYTGQGFAKGIGNSLLNVKQRAAEMAAAASDTLRGTNVPSMQNAASGASSTGYSSTINFDGMFAGANFNIRSDNDIRVLAREILDMASQAQRGMGT